MILSAQTIRRLKPLEPIFSRSTVFGMTFGLGPAGYDVRIEFDAEGSISGRELSAGGFLLASTIERFSMPANVVGIVHDKSSWARKGLTVQNTVIEPGWNGFLTLELTNHSNKEVLLKRGMPIAQVIFHWLDLETDSPYTGKYQDQSRGPQEAI